MLSQYSELIKSIESETKTLQKVKRISEGLKQLEKEDASWAIYFLMGEKISGVVQRGYLIQWCCEYAQLPEWMYKECYYQVGDSAETISLLITRDKPNYKAKSQVELHQLAKELNNIKKKPLEEKKKFFFSLFDDFSQREIFVFLKMITGGLRIGVTKKLLVRALSIITEKPEEILLAHLVGGYSPGKESYEELFSDDLELSQSTAYPFCLAHAIEDRTYQENVKEYFFEWKWDGIRLQIVKRQGEVYLWSRGEDIINESFPDLIETISKFPFDFVADGELLPCKEGEILSFSHLQPRLGRLKPDSKFIQENEVTVKLYDLLEVEGQDLRELPLTSRKEKLFRYFQNGPLHLSAVFCPSEWQHGHDLIREARDNRVEGMMVKRQDSPYVMGRKKGHWWKWKVDPHTLDLILLYAQTGTGKRGSLYTDYTFGIWKEGEVVPLVKAYSGLTDKEIAKLNGWIRKNAIEKFGPVRKVQLTQVMELGFEGITRSKRHKSGFALRFPRILRWRHDKLPKDADTIEAVQELYERYES